MEPSKPVLFTIGHSTHSIDAFISLLRVHAIQAIADVRSYPMSRFNPQFDRDTLASSLRSNGIYYVFLGRELGARREEASCYVENKVRYELVEKMPSFQSGLRRLANGASKMKVAIMCAEKDPLTCHRTILVAKAARPLFSRICHILEDGSVEEHEHAETRLLDAYDVQQEDLFLPRDQRLAKAYHLRADEIAYEEKMHQTSS